MSHHERCECHECTQARLSQFERDLLHIERGELRAELDIAYELHLLREAVQQIAGFLTASKQAKSLVVKILDSKGNTLMPAVLQIGQTAQAVAQEFSGPNGSGSPLPLAGVIAWTSSDPTIATVDPASGLVTAVGAGQATITGTDPANGLSGSDIVSDQPITAQSLVVTATATAGAAAPAVKR